MGTCADRLAYQLFVGVDIASATFTTTWSRDAQPTLRPMTFNQTPSGFAAFQQQLHQTGIAPAATLIVMEATGSYWITLAVTLHQAGYVVSVVNPARVHDYVKSLPRKGKTDPLDAGYLTQFAAERRPDPWTPPPAVYHELRQRLAARDALLEMRKLAQNHRHALSQWPIVVDSVLAQLDESIADLNRRMRQLEEELAVILQDGAWAESAALVLSISGIGLVTAAWLLVTTLNFTIAPTPESLAAYAGLAPLPYDSGSSVRGRRQIGPGGNRRLRTALYLATLSAARHNPVIRPFYQRLCAAGKPKKVARCAAARKLLQLAWAVVKHKRPFDPAYRVQHSAEARAVR
jgi:transposase